MSFSREVIRQWMRSVLSEKEWSNREWARRAGVGPSTISRFLAEKDAVWTPSTTTIDKLAAAAGSTPGDYIGKSVQSRNVNLVFVPLMIMDKTKGITPVKPAMTVPITQAVSEQAYAVPSEVSVTHAGIKRGDYLIVDPSAPMKHDQWVGCIFEGKVMPVMRWELAFGNIDGTQWISFADQTPTAVEPEEILGVITELNRRF